MEDGSMWGGLLVAWLLLAPLIGVAISSRWGGEHTSATLAHHGPGRAYHDNADVPRDRVDYAPTASERSIAGDAVRDRDIRDRSDGRGMPRH
jgi:hypothetical protein